MNLTSIFTGIGAAFAVGFAQAVLAPFVEFYVDTWREDRQAKKELVEMWRDMVRDVWRNGRVIDQLDDDDSALAADNLDSRYESLRHPIVIEMLRADERYYSLRNRMSESAMKEVQSEGKQTFGNLAMPRGLHIVSEEIDRIESEWGLVGKDGAGPGEACWWGLKGLTLVK